MSPTRRTPRGAAFAAAPLKIKTLAGSVRGFRRLVAVDRRLVAGCRRGGRGCRLDAVKQVVRQLQRLVVLGILRNVGLRAGLFVAVRLQVAAQRGFALGV